MLIEFNVSNFLSFSEEQTFSMVAANSVKEHSETNTFTNNKIKFDLLKSAAVYGDNSSGKSNFINSLSYMRSFALTSFKNALGENKNIINRKFKLNSDYDDKPSTFEIIFLYNNKKYRYGFELTDNKVETEWLFCVKKVKEIKLFTREIDDYYHNSKEFPEGKNIDEKTKDNVLCLSVMAHLNGEISNEVIKWFKKMKIVSKFDDFISMNLQDYIINSLEDDPKFKLWAKEAVSFLGISDISVDSIEVNKLIEKINDEKLKSFLKKSSNINEKAKKIVTWHKKYDKNNEEIEMSPFDLNNEESEGTIKFINLLALIYYTLKEGNILVIDEFDSSLHTLLARKIIEFFHLHNKNNAQLIFASHDTNLLKKEIFRRDQIWFTEKDYMGSTDLYSLVEYKEIKPRNDASYNKEYLSGKYGAIPFFSNFDKLLELIYE